MANQSEIGAELKRLTDTLPPPRGVKMEHAIPGYYKALSPFTTEEIAETIDRYLSAEWPDISRKFYPRAPELAHLVRLVRADHAKTLEKQARTEQAERDRAEQEESERLRIKTPEQKARAKALYDDFVMSSYGEKERRARERVERERAEVRKRYGMTDEVLAGVKDRPLPKGMKQVSDAAPGIPAPREEQPAKPKPEDFGGLS